MNVDNVDNLLNLRLGLYSLIEYGNKIALIHFCDDCYNISLLTF